VIHVKPTGVVLRKRGDSDDESDESDEDDDDYHLDPAFVEALEELEEVISVVLVFVILNKLRYIPMGFYMKNANAVTHDAVWLPNWDSIDYGEDVEVSSNLEAWCPHWFKNGPGMLKKAFADLEVDMFTAEQWRVATNPKLTAVQALNHIRQALLADPAPRVRYTKRHIHEDVVCA
jgi:hypothetical protein